MAISVSQNPVNRVGQLAEIHPQPRKLALAHKLGRGEDQQLLFSRIGRDHFLHHRFAQGSVVAREPFFIGLVEQVDAIKLRLSDETRRTIFHGGHRGESATCGGKENIFRQRLESRQSIGQ